MRKKILLLIALLCAVAHTYATQPVRCLDACTGGAGFIHVEGWAYDPDASNQSIDVQVCVYTDIHCSKLYGNIQEVIQANQPRPDVNEAKGITGNHGFSANIPIATMGLYYVKLFAIDTNGDGNPQIGAMTAVVVTIPTSVTVTVGEGAGQCNREPFYNISRYSLVQQIYTADEINMEGTITSIAFNYESSMAFSMSGVQVYLKQIDKSNFDDWSMVPLSEDDKVFEGTFSAEGAGWVTITFDNPFEYDGISNLLVCTVDPTYEYIGGDYWKYMFYYDKTEDKRCFVAYSGTVVPGLDGSNMEGVQSGFANERNMIRFNIDPGTFSKPDNLTLSSCTEEQVTLTWKAPVTVNPIVGYGYQFKKAGDADWSDEVTTTGTSATFSNLTADTDYKFRVRTIYESRNSPYQPINFCTAMSLPYEMGFEYNMDRWSMVDCDTYWNSGIDDIHDTGRRKRAARYSNIGFQFDQDDIYQKQQYLISPRFADDKAITMSFYYRIPTNLRETFYVGYSTTTNDKDAFTFCDTITAISSSWTKYEHTFPAEARYFAIKYVSNICQMFIDDFLFEESSSYAKPTTVSSNLTETEATLTWNVPSGATGYTYQYKKTIDGPWSWSVENTVNSPNVTISGLTPNTYYNFRVKALYGNNASNYVIYTFQTDANIVDLPYSDNFENGMGGWRMVDCKGSTEIRQPEYPHSGSYCFCFDHFPDQNQFLYSPHFAGGTPVKVSFYYKNYKDLQGWTAVFAVGYTSAKDAAVTWIGSAMTATDGAWHLYETIIPAEAQYVVICSLKEGNMFQVDDFSLTIPGAPTAISNVRSDDVRCTKVLRDGQLLIIRNDQTYTVDGRLTH